MKTRKKNIAILIRTLFFVCIMLTGCQKAPINGDLDGRWQVLEIESVGTVRDVKDDQLYYSFYLHVCNLTYYGGVFTEGNLRYENDEIYMDFPYINTTEGLASLGNYYGIYTNPVVFKVIHLDSKRLVMGNDESVITLRKF